ncbi:MAG: hypothetical protein ACR2OZ_19755 [Verrucomicrobiales bacterium]
MCAATLAGSCQPASKDLLYRVPGMERVTVRPNVVYKTADAVPLHADFFVPSADAPRFPRPGVIFILGDGPPEVLRSAKDWEFFQSYGGLAVASGYVGITFNHRSSQDYQNLAGH